MAEWETALDLLAQLRAGQVGEGGKPLDADTFSFNATINALGRGGEWQKAVALLREMTQAGLGVKVRGGDAMLLSCTRCIQCRIFRRFRLSPSAACCVLQAMRVCVLFNKFGTC